MLTNGAAGIGSARTLGFCGSLGRVISQGDPVGIIGSWDTGERVRKCRLYFRPDSETQLLEESIRFAHDCGVKIILSDFSPMHGTEDGKKSVHWADMKEPLSHNKTAFTIRWFGADYLNRVKTLARSLNGTGSTLAEWSVIRG